MSGKDNKWRQNSVSNLRPLVLRGSDSNYKTCSKFVRLIFYTASSNIKSNNKAEWLKLNIPMAISNIHQSSLVAERESRVPQPGAIIQDTSQHEIFKPLISPRFSLEGTRSVAISIKWVLRFATTPSPPPSNTPAGQRSSRHRVLTILINTFNLWRSRTRLILYRRADTQHGIVLYISVGLINMHKRHAPPALLACLFSHNPRRNAATTYRYWQCLWFICWWRSSRRVGRKFTAALCCLRGDRVDVCAVQALENNFDVVISARATPWRQWKFGWLTLV